MPLCIYDVGHHVNNLNYERMAENYYIWNEKITLTVNSPKQMLNSLIFPCIVDVHCNV